MIVYAAICAASTEEDKTLPDRQKGQTWEFLKYFLLFAVLPSFSTEWTLWEADLKRVRGAS